VKKLEVSVKKVIMNVDSGSREKLRTSWQEEITHVKGMGYEAQANQRRSHKLTKRITLVSG
jgi:hypothetical protein